MRAAASRPIGLAVALIAAAVVGLAWNGPLALRMIEYGDYPFHLLTAKTFAETGEITLPHFLLEVLLGGWYATGLFSSIESAGLQFLYTLHAATAVVVCWFIARGNGSVRALACSVALTGAVLMSAPILPSDIELDVFLIGYFPPNAYHNPTTLLTKPLLVLSLVAAVAAISRNAPLRISDALLATVPVALLAAAKPNYLGCLVPATMAVAAWRWWRAQAISWTRISLWTAAAVTSVGGTWLLYRSGELGATGGIMLAPFTVVMLHVGPDAAAIAERLLSSLAFPLAALLLWPRAIWRDTPSLLAWTALPGALVIAYFLAERGERLAHGNFLWTGQMAVFVLFVTTAAFLRRQVVARLERPGEGSWWFWARVMVPATLLVLHVHSGIRHVLYVLSPADWAAWWA